MEESINAIEGAIRESGYTPVCIKHDHFPDRIMDKALSEIRKSRFIIIDLTNARNSVFFEAGFAMGINIEAIYVCKTTLPEEFYVRHYQCYKYKDGVELKDILKDAIAARIKK
jgi:nucleoside 2-deoxyribosyltransferase